MALATEKQLLAGVATHAAAALAAWNVEVRRARLNELNDSIQPLQLRLSICATGSPPPSGQKQPLAIHTTQ